MINEVLGNMVGGPKPEVGMGCTELFCSDRKAATIVEISKSGKQLWVVRDKAVRTDNNGMSESQEYEFTPQEDCGTNRRHYKLRKTGHWVEAGANMIHGTRLLIGIKQEYYDFSF